MNRFINLRSAKLTIEFSCVNAHAGYFGTELADRLAKDAASQKQILFMFEKILKTAK